MERERVFSKKSELQIDEIYQYVYNASNDKETAKKFVNELLNKTEILKKEPQLEKYIRPFTSGDDFINNKKNK